MEKRILPGWTTSLMLLPFLLESRPYTPSAERSAATISGYAARVARKPTEVNRGGRSWPKRWASVEPVTPKGSI